ncbi:MAG: hypothetical protein ACK515_17785 [bacterium]
MPRSRNLADSATQGGVPDPGTIFGLTLSRASATTFQIAVGTARNEDAGTARALVLASALTKSLSAFAAGNNNGGLDTGSVATNTWYHVHLIRRDSDGAIDALYSLSATTPTMPSGWTARRRLGSIRTDGSSQITPFVQNNDVFTWDTPVSDLNVTNPGTAAVTRTLTVPTGVIVYPVVSWQVVAAASTAVGLLVTPLTIADTAPSTTLTTVRARIASASGGEVAAVVSDIPTNTSAQVRTRCDSSSASDVLRATTLGWIDTRGH